MGNCGLRSDDAEKNELLNLKSFKLQYAVGRGTFGKVWKASSAKGPCAVKQMLKSRVIQRRSISSVFNELRFLSSLSSPFIVNMLYAFQDSQNLYMVLEFFEGGDLRYHLGNRLTFSEEQTRFFIACIVLALEDIEKHEIVHKDIKPENLVLDRFGYLRLTDFGIARILCAKNAGESNGTPGYMAPEIMFNKNYGYTADYFALGVIIYEFATSYRPFPGLQREVIKTELTETLPRLDPSLVNWSQESMDFCNQLLDINAKNRPQTTQEIKEHPWLKDFPWKDLRAKKLSPPYVPGPGKHFDSKHVNRKWLDYNGKVNKRKLNVFQGYFYDHSHNEN